MTFRYLTAVVAGAMVVFTAGVQAGEPTVDELVQRVVSSDLATRRAAYQQLMKLGPKAEAAVPGLTKIVNPLNPDMTTRAAGNRVLWAGNVLYMIGTRSAYNVLSKAQSTLAQRIADASVRSDDLDNLPIPLQRSWRLANHFGTLLSREWPRAGINTPPQKMTVAQLHEHIDDLTRRIGEAERNLKVAEQAVRDLTPNTSLQSYYRGMIQGFHDAIPKMELELMQAKRLLAAKHG